jgi:asparagine synthase (glutamine-hydrolysing)
MCGICGVFEPARDTGIEPAVLKRMADSIRHRGPDAEGFYHADPGVGLAHRRLSIIDVEGGAQPLSNEDGSIWIVFNGEVYNFAELNDRYLATRHTFRTRCDTETIVHLYEELGEACFAELRGMFALALWDGRKKRLLLARDRLGKKPLYYSWDGRRLVFGSEIKALWGAGGLSKEVDPEAVLDYFALQYVPAPKTIYRSIRKLRPAHYAVVDGPNFHERPYWDLCFNAPRELTEEQWCDEFLAEYRKAVQLRLVSDVPLGAFLSGGVDSSSVVALMSEVQSPVTTCSVGFAEAQYNEADDAREFAASVGANHFEQVVKPDAIALVGKLAWHYDEPFADSSAVPTYYVSKVAREHVTVALSGDGGDENFAGYGRYKLMMREEQLRGMVPEVLRKSVFGPLGNFYPKLGWAPRIFRAKSTFQSLSGSVLDGYLGSSATCPPGARERMFSPDLLKQVNGYDPIEVLEYHYNRATTKNPLSRLLYLDIKTYLVDDILAKVDRASMANALEVRCPLLDHKLMELIAQMPPGLKLRNGTGKYIFKKALERVLPGKVLTRAKKGFAVPLVDWFRGELKDFAHAALFDAPDDLLNRQYLESCWRQHQRRQRDWSALLWCVLMFRAWREVAKAA